MLNERKEIMRLAIGDFDTAKKVSSKNQAKTVLGTPQVSSFIYSSFTVFSCADFYLFKWMAPEVLNANEEGQYSFSADSNPSLLMPKF